VTQQQRERLATVTVKAGMQAIVGTPARAGMLEKVGKPATEERSTKAGT
jgi:predicted metal-dependent phosphotriesterase family hydrolase